MSNFQDKIVTLVFLQKEALRSKVLIFIMCFNNYNHNNILFLEKFYFVRKKKLSKNNLSITFFLYYKLNLVTWNEFTTCYDYKEAAAW